MSINFKEFLIVNQMNRSMQISDNVLFNYKILTLFVFNFIIYVIKAFSLILI